MFSVLFEGAPANTGPPAATAENKEAHGPETLVPRAQPGFF